MMNLSAIFDWTLRTSAMATVLAVLILVIKRLFKNKLGVRWHYGIWFLLLIKLFIPFGPQSAVSIYNFVSWDKQFELVESHTLPRDTNIAPGMISKTSLPNGAIQQLDTETAVTGEVLPANISEKPEESAVQKDVGRTETRVIVPGLQSNSSNILSSTLGMIPYIWLAGVVLLVLYTFVSNFVFWRNIRRMSVAAEREKQDTLEDCLKMMGIEMAIPLAYTPEVQTPVLFGYLKPRILLPVPVEGRMTDEELRYALLHELAHLKRRDIAVNWLMVLMQIIHWFNPVLWYAFYRMRQDREIACDALALSYIEPEESRKYGDMILNVLRSFSKQKRIPGVAGMLEGKSHMKRRMAMIRIFSKNSYRWSALAIVLLIIIALVALTSGRDKKPVDPNAAISPVDTRESVVADDKDHREPSSENADEQKGLLVQGNHITGKIDANPDLNIQECAIDAELKPFPASSMKSYKLSNEIVSFKDFKEKWVPALLPDGVTAQGFKFEDTSENTKTGRKILRYDAEKGDTHVSYSGTGDVFQYSNLEMGDGSVNFGAPGDEVLAADQDIPGFSMTNAEARKLADEYIEKFAKQTGMEGKIKYDKTNVYHSSVSLRNVTSGYSIQYAMEVDGINTESDVYTFRRDIKRNMDNDELSAFYDYTKYASISVSVQDKGISSVYVVFPETQTPVEEKPVISPEQALQGVAKHMDVLDDAPRRIVGVEAVYPGIFQGYDEEDRMEFHLIPHWRVTTDDYNTSGVGIKPYAIYVNAYTGVPITRKLSIPEAYAPNE